MNWVTNTMSKNLQNNKPKIEDLDERSNEVREILGKAPHWVVQSGITVVFIITILLFIGSSLISYNDVVSVPIVLTGKNKPITIKSNIGGRLSNILAVPGQKIEAGAILAIIKSTTNFEDAIKLSEKLEKYGTEISDIDSLYSVFPSHPELGQLQFAYGDFISEYENYITSTEENSDPKKSIGVKAQKIRFQQMSRALQNLKTNLDLWKNQFLITAPISGKVVFVDMFNQFEEIPKDASLFAIIPNDIGTVQGEATLSMNNASKVKKGQKVIIKLSDHPFWEWGSLEGHVTNIYYVPKEYGGPLYNLNVEIHGLTTSAGRQIQFEHEMLGSAEIITEELTVLQRIFQGFGKLFK